MGEPPWIKSAPTTGQSTCRGGPPCPPLLNPQTAAPAGGTPAATTSHRTFGRPIVAGREPRAPSKEQDTHTEMIILSEMTIYPLSFSAIFAISARESGLLRPPLPISPINLGCIPVFTGDSIPELFGFEDLALGGRNKGRLQRTGGLDPCKLHHSDVTGGVVNESPKTMCSPPPFESHSRADRQVG